MEQVNNFLFVYVISIHIPRTYARNVSFALCY